MILTITMNPSVDISYRLDHFKLDNVNRCDDYQKTAGGKGLNVTRVIHQMDYPVMATGLLGGSLGNFVKEELNGMNISHEFYDIQADTRNCIAILHDHKQTEILETGPTILTHEQSSFIELYSWLLKKTEIVTISGSLPKGMDSAFYVELLMKTDPEIKVILDTSGLPLKSVLTSSKKPYAIKPNETEIAQLLSVSSETLDTSLLMNALNDQLFDGIPLIMVSKGAKGALVKYHGEFFEVSIPKVATVNPVGSGDSTVAGMAIGLLSNDSIENLIKRAMTLGVLNAIEEKTGYINLNNYQTIYDQVFVKKIK